MKHEGRGELRVIQPSRYAPTTHCEDFEETHHALLIEFDSSGRE